ncbi:MAG: prepilin-type cleavage/methylation domain-containing protein, partial [Verrucomicrobiae bacterium]|nr:prepilin-type cleavage/methylation domain-containing protein [Verrucomicrobiae bacterium]
QWALENNKTSGDTITWSDVQGYLKAGTRLYTSNGTDLIGNPYRLQAVSSGVKVNQNTRNAFSGIGFSWGPY